MKVFIVTRSYGEYSDRCDEVDSCWLTEGEANVRASLIEGRKRDDFDNWSASYEELEIGVPAEGRGL